MFFYCVTNPQPSFIYLLLYVDDIIEISNSEEHEHNIIFAITSKGIKINKTTTNQVLGMKLTRLTPIQLHLSQPNYITNKVCW
jgi:hypothetical protein